MIYHCPYSDEKFLLVVRKGLWVPSMEHNLACPFIMREAGIEVNEKAKQHCDNPTIEDHTIYDPSSGMRIPLQLDGIFSCFPTRALTKEEVEDIGEFIDGNRVVYLSPKVPKWNPNDDYYAEKEAGYLTSQGEMAHYMDDPRPRCSLVDAAEVASLYASIPVATASAVEELIDSRCESYPDEFPMEVEEEAICRLHGDSIAYVSSVEPLLNEAEFQKRMFNVELQTSVGITAGCMSVSAVDDDDYLFTRMGQA